MKLHYMGKYNLDPDSLPHSEHIDGAVKFREAEDSKELSKIATIINAVIVIVMMIPLVLVAKKNLLTLQAYLGLITSFLALFPHEILHAVCFKEDVYLYTNLKQGMLFVVGPELMSKSRYIFMSLLPNIILGVIPYIIGLIFPSLSFFGVFGVFCTASGAGDYYNVFNAATQMPKGAKTYLYKFNSYWYIP